MSNKLLYSYAIAKTLYEKYGDYIDTFFVFVLKVLPENKKSLGLSEIQKKIQEESGLFIPAFSLRSIVTRAKKNGYLTESAGFAALTEKGSKYLKNLEPQDLVNQRINRLLDDIRTSINQKTLPLHQIYEMVVCFINDNFEPIIDFLDSSGKCQLHSRRSSAQHEEHLVEYFGSLDKKAPELYKTVQDILYGSIISLSLLYSNIAEINSKFKNVKVFLDSNFLFSLFELHYPEVDKPVKELFDILKEYGFKLYVFDFTIQEIVHVLGDYVRENYKYFAGIKVNSIHSNLKDKGWTAEDVRDFIQKIEEKIWNLGVEIFPTRIDLDAYVPKKEYVDKIQRYKPLQPYQNEKLYTHDLAALEKIREIRGGLKREIERSDAIFVTSDLRLSRFNFFELKHKSNFTISEIIPDRLLTNILWLKKPHMTKEISLQSIIAFHSKGMFIDQKVWQRFYFNLKKLKDEKNVSERDIATLLYCGNIEETLRGISDNEVTKIDPSFIEERIREAKQKIDAEIEKKLETQKTFFGIKATDELMKEQQKWEDRLEAIKSRVEVKSKKIATLITIFEIAVFYVIILVVAATEYRENKTVIITVLPFLAILSFLGLKFDIAHIKRDSYEQKFNIIYRKKLKELDL